MKFDPTIAQKCLAQFWNLNAEFGHEHNGLRPFFMVENLTDQLNNIPLSTDGLMVPMRGRTYHLGLSYAPTKSW